MAYPKGGRADKYGNRFEYNWAIFELQNVSTSAKNYDKVIKMLNVQTKCSLKKLTELGN